MALFFTTPYAGPRPPTLRQGCRLALLTGLAMVAACGGSGPSPGTTGTITVPPPPTIAVTANLSAVKQLTLSWHAPDLALAQRALVLEDPDGNGPLAAEQLADVPASDGTATLDISLPVALRASYRVALCNGGQCEQSAPLQLGPTLERYAGRIKALNPQSQAEFGETVALSRDGKVLAVAALNESIATANAQEGVVHLYEHIAPGQWVARGQVSAPHPDDDDDFGGALTLSGDGQVLVVGAPKEDAQGNSDGGLNDTAPNAGAAYVYRRVGDAWVFSAYLKGSQVSESARFGSALDISDDGLRLVVGAPRDSGGTGSSDGAVYEFIDNQGTWTEGEIFRDGNSTDGETFGAAVALDVSGSVLAIGSPGNAASGQGVYAAPIGDAVSPPTGAVHLYRRSAGAWAYEAFVKPPTVQGQDNRFGGRLDLDAAGNTLIITNHIAGLDLQNQWNPADTTYWNSGVVHVYARTNGLWGHEALLRQPHPRGEDRFGWSASLSADGRTVIVGTYNQDTPGSGLDVDESVGGMDDHGSAYVFHRRTGGWSAATVLKPSDHSNDATANTGIWFGRSVAISGDGRTVAIGAAGHDGPGSAISTDPANVYSYDPVLANTGTVFLY